MSVCAVYLAPSFFLGEQRSVGRHEGHQMPGKTPVDPPLMSPHIHTHYMPPHIFYLPAFSLTTYPSTCLPVYPSGLGGRVRASHQRHPRQGVGPVPQVRGRTGPLRRHLQRSAAAHRNRHLHRLHCAGQYP